MDIIAIIISSTIVFAIPLLLGALAGMFSERSGVINIALEGIMIIGSLFAAVFLSTLVGDTEWAINHPQMAVFVSILVSGVAGGLFSLLLAYASIKLKANQVISGTALNIFAPAFAILLAYSVYGTTSDISIPRFVRITPVLLGWNVSEWPSWIYTIVFKGLFLTTPVAIILLVVSFVVLYKTKFGLRLRACGEHPSAADSVGVKVIRMRYIGVAISGFLAGIGGFAFSLVNGLTHNPDVLGYGFLALAVMIFGNWKPFRILFAALFFSFFKTIAVVSSTLDFFPTFGLRYVENLYFILPYVITLLVLVFTSKQSRAPKAEGIPYDPGKR